jgi:hypothetical protein
MDDFIPLIDAHVIPGTNTLNTNTVAMGDCTALAVAITAISGTSLSSARLTGSNDDASFKQALSNNGVGTPLTLDLPSIPGTAITVVTKITCAFVKVQVSGVGVMLSIAVKPIKF